MRITPSMFLKSTSGDEDADFGHAHVFITEHNAKGSVGFIVNKQFPRRLNELEEFRNNSAIAIYDGGPVDREHLFFIHRRPELVEGGLPIDKGIFVGGNFATAVALLDEQLITPDDIKIFIGYCGWDYAQLETEIESGEWLLEEGLVANVFFR